MDHEDATCSTSTNISTSSEISIYNFSQYENLSPEEVSPLLPKNGNKSLSSTPLQEPSFLDAEIEDKSCQVPKSVYTLFNTLMVSSLTFLSIVGLLGVRCQNFRSGLHACGIPPENANQTENFIINNDNDTSYCRDMKLRQNECRALSKHLPKLGGNDFEYTLTLVISSSLLLVFLSAILVSASFKTDNEYSPSSNSADNKLGLGEKRACELEEVGVCELKETEN